MFLKHLLITNDEGKIRRINFRFGLNLIVDDTESETQETGNNVGKTTLLYLIDYCLGGKAEAIFRSSDRSVNMEVQEFLQETNVEVELCLVGSPILDSPEVRIRRNFLLRNKALREINGVNYKNNDLFEAALQQAILGIQTSSPSYRQIISHSLRIDDLRLTQPLNTFPTTFGNKVQYESLHLFMFGANKEESEDKVTISSKLIEDNNFRKRLEKKGVLSMLHSRLGLLQKDLQKLEKEKEALKLNPDFEKDLDSLANVRNQLKVLGSQHNSLVVRRSLINEAADDMKAMMSSANADQVKMIYQQARVYNEKLHHTFKDLLLFHNGMLERRADFVTEELPQLEEQIDKCINDIKQLRNVEIALQEKLNLTVSYETFDDLITRISEKSREIGELQESIYKIEDVEKSIRQKNDLLEKIDKGLFDEAWRKYIQAQLDKFNEYFAEISRALYDEDYLVSFEEVSYKGNPCYQFKTDAPNSFGSGKKQGEIICFDLAYVKFADQEEIPCLHFNLYDKTELVHGNQLSSFFKCSEYAGNVQNVVAMLKDKLPKDMDCDSFIVERLSQDSRLFDMENSIWYKNKYPQRTNEE